MKIPKSGIPLDQKPLTSCIAIAVLVLCFANTMVQARTSAGVMEGIADVKDGDGILINDIEIRLQGIAAPEDNEFKRDPGGPESTANLRLLVQGKFVRCELDGTRTRNRPVGICYLNGADTGEHQVRTGHARDCPRFSRGRYAKAEQAARAAGKNLSAIYPLPAYCMR